jgi:alpha-tubulin suppressor-like RCC1 family protein
MTANYTFPDPIQGTRDTDDAFSQNLGILTQWCNFPLSGQPPQTTVPTSFQIGGVDIGSRYITKSTYIDFYPYMANSGRTKPQLWVFGGNSLGQLGNGTTIFYSSPVQVGTLTDWKSVYSSFTGAGAIKSDGSLWTWGANNRGFLGNGTTIGYSSPIQVGNMTDWSKVVTGSDSMYAIKTDGTLWGCGYNSRGQLGNTTTISYSSPIQIGNLSNWSQVCIGVNAMMGLQTNGTLWCCGYNYYGQFPLGSNGAFPFYSSPVQVGALNDWAQLSFVPGGGVAIKTDGSLWYWGQNNTGQAGMGFVLPGYSSPVQVGALKDWAKVSVGGGGHVLAIKTDGSLWGWGANSFGQTANNAANYSSPVQIGLLTNWKSIAAGNYSSFGLKTDGTMWSWGSGADGQLGLGNTINYSSPIQVGSLSTWKSISSDGVTFAGIVDGYY